MAAGLRSDLTTLWRHISPHRRRQLLVIAVLMPVTAMAELAMVGSLGERGEGAGWPPLPALAIILVTLGVIIYFAVDDEDSSFGATAISPG